jgi:glutamyl-tRNA reductase
MQIILAGINHKTAAIGIREQLAFDPAASAEALKALKTEYPSGEFVLLSTCNRVECYAAAPPSDGPDPEALAKRLAGFRKVEYDAIRPYLYIKLQEDAVGHLFTVASSLDSMVIGESQIVAQVKEGYKRACECGSTGKVLNHLFHAAFHVSKEIFSSTSIAARRVSIAGVGVDLARQLFSDIRNVKITVIGAGQMGELLIEHFRHLRCADITVVNRSEQRACQVAEEYAIRHESWDGLEDQFVETGIVVGAATAQEGYLFTKETFKTIMARRRNRPLLVLDLAVPRSFDPSIDDLDNLYLYGIDDLGKVIEDNIQFREGDLEQAVEILCRHQAEFMTWYQLRDVGPLLGEIQDAFGRIRDAELQKFFSGLRCEASCRDQMEASVRSVVNKLLHCVVKNIVNLAQEQGPSQAEQLARGILSRAEGVLREERDKEGRNDG